MGTAACSAKLCGQRRYDIFTRALIAVTGRPIRAGMLDVSAVVLFGVAATSVVLGVGVGRAPLAAILGAALALMIVGIAALPALALLAIFFVRASLDTSGELISFAGTNPAGALGIAVAIGGVAALLLWRPELPARRLQLTLLAFVGWSIVSLAFTPALLEGVRSVLRSIAMLVLFCLAAWTVRNPQDLRRTAWVVAASALVPVSVGLLQLATGSTQSRQGFSSIAGTFIYPNGFALYLLIVLTLGIVLLFESRGIARRGILLGGFPFVMMAFVVTYARAEWIGLVVLLLVLALLQYRRLVPFAVVTLVIGVVAVPSSVGLVQERFSDLNSASARYDDNSWSWRITNWQRMSHFATERPLTGHGLSSYPPLSYQEFGTSTDRFVIEGSDSGILAHNDYLMLAVELGLPGLLLWVAVLIGIARAMLGARSTPAVRPYASAVFAITIAVLCMSAADNVIATTAAMYYLFGIAGAVAGADFHARRAAAG